MRKQLWVSRSFLQSLLIELLNSTWPRGMRAPSSGWGGGAPTSGPQSPAPYPQPGEGLLWWLWRPPSLQSPSALPAPHVTQRCPRLLWGCREGRMWPRTPSPSVPPPHRQPPRSDTSLLVCACRWRGLLLPTGWTRASKGKAWPHKMAPVFLPQQEGKPPLFVWVDAAHSLSTRCPLPRLSPLPQEWPPGRSSLQPWGLHPPPRPTTLSIFQARVSAPSPRPQPVHPPCLLQTLSFSKCPLVPTEDPPSFPSSLSHAVQALTHPPSKPPGNFYLFPGLSSLPAPPSSPLETSTSFLVHLCRQRECDPVRPGAESLWAVEMVAWGWVLLTDSQGRRAGGWVGPGRGPGCLCGNGWSLAWA